MNKRITVFFFYDKDGIVREFVYYLLKSLKQISQYLLVVSNGEISPIYKNRLLSICDDLLERDNIGFDVWAYKEAFDYITWDNLVTYDELIFANFTCYGPIFPFNEMFKKMESSSCDFWGCAKHPEQPNYLLPQNRGYINEHIMSYFTVVRHNMLSSQSFKSYWDNLPFISTKTESTAFHEVVFTKHFEDLGFKSGAYVDLAKFKGRCNNNSIIKADELLINEHCPLLKRRAFIFPLYLNNLDVSFSMQSKGLIDYLEKNTDYDVNLIWDDILPTTPLSLLRNNLQLLQISDLDDKIHNNSKVNLLKDHCIIVFIKENSPKKCIEDILSSLPSNVHSFIYSKIDLDDYKHLILHNNYNIECTPDIFIKIINQNENVIKQFKYVSYIYVDKESNNQLSLPDEEIYTYSSNILYKSKKSLLFQLLNLQKTGTRIGAFMPMPVSFSQFFGKNYCQLNFSLKNQIFSLYQALDLKIPFDTMPLTNGFPCFTTNVEYLLNFCKEILNIKLQDNIKYSPKVISHIFPLWLQNKGMISVWIITSNYATTELNNYNYMRFDLLDKIGTINNITAWDYRSILNSVTTKMSLADRYKKQLNYSNKLSFNDKYELMKYELTLSDAFKVFRRSAIRSIKNLLKKITFAGKKKDEHNYVGNAYISNLYVENEEITLLLQYTRLENKVPYLRIGEYTIFPTKFMTIPENFLLKKMAKMNSKMSCSIYKFGINALLFNTKLTVELNKNELIRLNFVNYQQPYNLLDLAKYKKTITIVNNVLYCNSKFKILNLLLNNESTFLGKISLIMEAFNPIKNVWLFAENEGANDNSYEFFKYVINNQQKKCFYIAKDKSVIEEKYRSHVVISNSIKHFILLNLASKIFTSFTYREALPSANRKSIAQHLTFINAKWYLIPHGMYIGKNVDIIHRLMWGDPHILYACNKYEMENWSHYSEISNIKHFGFPRFEKWKDSVLDCNSIFMFFTWRQLFNTPKFTHEQFAHSDYIKDIVSLCGLIQDKFPDKQINYCFHHEIVRHGFDIDIIDLLKRASLSSKINFIYYNNLDNITKFNAKFSSSKFLITDLSSVSYDFAYKNNSIVINYLNKDFISNHYELTSDFYKYSLGFPTFNLTEVVNLLSECSISNEILDKRALFFSDMKNISESIYRDCTKND